jgi:hypothetical protein
MLEILFDALRKRRSSVEACCGVVGWGSGCSHDGRSERANWVGWDGEARRSRTEVGATSGWSGAAYPASTSSPEREARRRPRIEPLQLRRGGGRRRVRARRWASGAGRQASRRLLDSLGRTLSLLLRHAEPEQLLPCSARRRRGELLRCLLCLLPCARNLLL